MLPSCNEISTCQSAPTQDTMDKYNQVLDYVWTHPNSTIRYHASDVILMTDTDYTYLVLLEACSRIAGYYYFTNRMLYYYKGTNNPNVPLLEECKTLKAVFPSSTESEIGVTFEKWKIYHTTQTYYWNYVFTSATHHRINNHHWQSHMSSHTHLFYKILQIGNLGYEIPLDRRPFFLNTYN